MINKIINWLRPKSTCCKKPMTSVLEMELDRMLYECPECKKEWIQQFLLFRTKYNKIRFLTNTKILWKV